MRVRVKKAKCLRVNLFDTYETVENTFIIVKALKVTLLSSVVMSSIHGLFFFEKQ